MWPPWGRDLWFTKFCCTGNTLINIINKVTQTLRMVTQISIRMKQIILGINLPRFQSKVMWWPTWCSEPWATCVGIAESSCLHLQDFLQITDDFKWEEQITLGMGLCLLTPHWFISHMMGWVGVGGWSLYFDRFLNTKFYRQKKRQHCSLYAISTHSMELFHINKYLSGGGSSQRAG